MEALSQKIGLLIGVQILTGFIGSLIASYLIYLYSQQRFNNAIDASTDKIIKNFQPILDSIIGIANEIKEIKNTEKDLKSKLGE